MAPSPAWPPDSISPSDMPPGRPPGGPRPDHGRAALLTWLAGGLSLLLFGCCGGSFLVAGISATTEELARQLPVSQLPADARHMIRPFMIALGGAAVALMALPGLVNLLLGFRIRRGEAGPARAAGWLMIGQAVIAAFLLLLSLLGNLNVGNPLGLLFNLVLIGGYLALLIAAIRAVRPLGVGPGAEDRWSDFDDDDEEPWNTPGPG